jgi:hypothetical protein
MDVRQAVMVFMGGKRGVLRQVKRTTGKLAAGRLRGRRKVEEEVIGRSDGEWVLFPSREVVTHRATRRNSGAMDPGGCGSAKEHTCRWRGRDHPDVHSRISAFGHVTSDSDSTARKKSAGVCCQLGQV